jgi:hypothetical protein
MIVTKVAESLWLKNIELGNNMNLTEKQLDVIDLTKSIRDIHYKLQMECQGLHLKVVSLEKENAELKAKLELVADKLQLM